MDSNPFAHNAGPRYPHHSLLNNNLANHNIQSPPPPTSSFYPSIDVDALAAGVQRFLPGPAARQVPAGYPHNHNHTSNSSYIALPPGVDPATVDFRTFYPYNPSEVKHRKRTTRPQLKVLEETFKRETKPNAALRKQLAAQLEMTPRGVQVWFQNRRAKEKNIAKKASSSSANGRKPINQDGQKGIDGGRNSSNFDAADGDDQLDRDDGDVDVDVDVAADDDTQSNCEQPARPATGRQAPGTTTTPGACALDERNRSSHSSSNSPESTSPELTPPSGLVDIPPHVDVSPPSEDDASAGRRSEAKLHGADASGLGFPPSSWQGPQRSMSRTPTGMDVEYAGEYGASGMNIMMPGQDRRPSLPTHLSIGPSRVRAGYHGSPRLPSMAFGALNASRMPGFDPSVRRMSLDRLASHPYAHLAAQANSAVYGSSLSRYRPTLPATTHSTPTLTPQARTTDLPPITQTHIDGSHSTGNGNDGTSANGDANSSSNSGIPELSLPPQMQHHHHNHHPSLSPPAPEVRPELMHRQSLPVHIAMPGSESGQHFPSNATTNTFPPPPQSANPMSMRFPRQGHVYTVSSRSYPPPIAGPLPNPNFSFGSGSGSVGTAGAGNGEGDAGSQGDGTNTPDMALQSQLNNFQFPAIEEGNGKDNNGSNGGSGSVVGGNGGLDMEIDGDPHSTLPTGALSGPRSSSAVYYRDTQGVHGAPDLYPSRFGSIASTVSITESESSVTSGPCFSSESASNFEMQEMGVPSAYSDARRASCTGSMLDMFSNLDMHNGSQSSLPHPHGDSHKPQQDNHAHPHQHQQLQSQHQQASQQVPISRSSELALALMPEDDNKSSIYGGDNGSNVNVTMNDANDAGMYQRASMSSSDLSHSHAHSLRHAHSYGHVHRPQHRHPLATSSRSAASSRSSLGIPPPRLARLETDKLDFMHNYDAVSETGHYSPVSQSHPLSPAPFEYPLTEPNVPAHGGINGSVASLPSLHEGESSGHGHGHGMMNRTPPNAHQYGVGVNGVNGHGQAQGQHSQFYGMSGPYTKDGTYVQPQQSSSYSLHGHSSENVSGYGYYS